MFRPVDQANDNNTSTNLNFLWDLPSDMLIEILHNLNLIDMKSLHIALQSQSSIRKRLELNFFTGTLNPFFILEPCLKDFPGLTAKELFFLIEDIAISTSRTLVQHIAFISFAEHCEASKDSKTSIAKQYNAYIQHLQSNGEKWVKFLDCKRAFSRDELENAFQMSKQKKFYDESAPQFEFASAMLNLCSNASAAPFFSIIFKQYGSKSKFINILKNRPDFQESLLKLLVALEKNIGIKNTELANTKNLEKLADMIIDKFEVLANIILMSINNPESYFIRHLIKTHPQLLQMILPLSNNGSFLMIAITKQNYAISEFFLKNGADPNAMYARNVDSTERTVSPLAIAIENILIDAKNNKPYDNRLVDLLIEHGADPFLDCADYAGDDGKSPYETCKDLIANTNPYYKDLPAELINLLQTFVNQWSAMPRVARDPNYIDPFSNRGHIMRLNAM